MGDIETSHRKFEKTNEAIDHFQELVDLHDAKLDLKCEVEGHDYGIVLIRELEELQHDIFETRFNRPSRDEEDKMGALATDMLSIFDGLLDPKILEGFTVAANQGLATKFLTTDSLKELERRAMAGKARFLCRGSREV
ncbi:MAG: hypothetical protein UY05_C0011G0011 [Candidatus Peregrinibacteria bacterium GW2011_GWA2_47_7]|nr:MAG: hypothetical protein UY05_C0011G0011 [Candidatus Peregrinibacteria bacterium GW2011_GWA2_47_7]